MRASRRSKMRELISEHKEVQFKAGDLIEFTGRHKKRVEGILAAIDERDIKDEINELLVVSQEPIFQDSCILDREEWEETNYGVGLHLLDKYDGWYWDWVSISDASFANTPFGIDELIEKLGREVE